MIMRQQGFFNYPKPFVRFPVLFLNYNVQRLTQYCCVFPVRLRKILILLFIKYRLTSILSMVRHCASYVVQQHQLHFTQQHDQIFLTNAKLNLSITACLDCCGALYRIIETHSTSLCRLQSIIDIAIGTDSIILLLNAQKGGIENTLDERSLNELYDRGRFCTII